MEIVNLSIENRLMNSLVKNIPCLTNKTKKLWRLDGFWITHTKELWRKKLKKACSLKMLFWRAAAEFLTLLKGKSVFNTNMCFIQHLVWIKFN